MYHNVVNLSYISTALSNYFLIDVLEVRLFLFSFKQIR